MQGIVGYHVAGSVRIVCAYCKFENRCLVVSIEAAIDMSNHVISQNRMRAPSDYADSFMVLGEAGALEKDFVNRLTTMVKFRNRLVHIYWEVNDEQIWEIITANIGDIEEFHQTFLDFLKSD